MDQSNWKEKSKAWRLDCMVSTFMNGEILLMGKIWITIVSVIAVSAKFYCPYWEKSASLGITIFSLNFRCTSAGMPDRCIVSVFILHYYNFSNIFALFLQNWMLIFKFLWQSNFYFSGPHFNPHGKTHGMTPETCVVGKCEVQWVREL